MPSTRGRSTIPSITASLSSCNTEQRSVPQPFAPNPDRSVPVGRSCCGRSSLCRHEQASPRRRFRRRRRLRADRAELVEGAAAGAGARARRAEWVGAVRALLASELALHGLAYLGVLLTFIGAFGFVVFAYGELDRSLRPVAEAVVPLVCFVTAWFLRRQQAPHVAAGLEFLGGLLLPLVAYASLVDDAALPPDLVGAPLVAALALVSLALCGGYAAWSAKHPASPLRFLVAPMAWQVVWALGLAFADELVAGVAIRTPNQWQMAAYAIAVVASIALANAFPTRRLARETRASPRSSALPSGTR